VNRTEIKNRILEGINDVAGDPVIFTDTQLNDLIDEAAEFLVAEIKAIRRTAFVPFLPGTTFYTTLLVAPDMMTPTRLWTPVNNRKLTAVGMDQLDDFNEQWMETAGDPEVWFPVSWDMFGVWPHSAAGGGTLRVDYLAWPRALMDDDDESELPEATQDALVLYGQFQGLLKKWDGEGASNLLRALQAHKSLAQSRSGLLRVSAKSFRRPRFPGRDFPSDIRTEGV